MAKGGSDMMMIMMMCMCMGVCVMCMMGPFGELFKGVGSLFGATGNLLGTVTGGAAKGVNAVGDVVSGKAFKGDIKRVDDPQMVAVLDQLKKKAVEEQQKQKKQKEEEKKAGLKSVFAQMAARGGPKRL